MQSQQAWFGSANGVSEQGKDSSCHPLSVAIVGSSRIDEISTVCKITSL